MSRTLSTPPDAASIGGGAALLILGLCFAALSGAQMKLLAESLPVILIVWFRFTGYFLIMTPIALWRAGRNVFRLRQAWAQILRGFMLVSSTIFFIIGSKTLDYADAIAVLYAYPFLITLLAPFALGERAGLVTWISVIAGFVGVLLVARPTPGGLADPGALWVLGCAAMVSLQMILNRRLGAVSDPVLTSLWGAGVAACVSSVFVFSEWRAISAEEAWMLMTVAALAALSQTLMVIAYARSPAADLAPFAYTELIAAVAFGFLFFGTLPDALSGVGIGVIVAAGVMVARSQGARAMARRQTKI